MTDLGQSVDPAKLTPPVEVGRDTRHMRLSDPEAWARMPSGERAAYDGGWLQASMNILSPSHRGVDR